MRGQHRKTCFLEILYCCLLIRCCGNAFSDGNLGSTAYSKVASVSVASQKCLAYHCLVIIASTRSTVPAFVIVSQYSMSQKQNVVRYWVPAADTRKFAILWGAMFSGALLPMLQASEYSQEPAAFEISLPMYQTTRCYNNLYICICRRERAILYPLKP
jgi:hypothetical protein